MWIYYWHGNIQFLNMIFCFCLFVCYSLHIFWRMKLLMWRCIFILGCIVEILAADKLILPYKIIDIIMFTHVYNIQHEYNVIPTCTFIILHFFYKLFFKDANYWHFTGNFFSSFSLLSRNGTNLETLFEPQVSSCSMFLCFLPAAGGSMERSRVPKLKRYSTNRGGMEHSSSERVRVRQVTSRSLWSKWSSNLPATKVIHIYMNSYLYEVSVNVIKSCYPSIHTLTCFTCYITALARPLFSSCGVSLFPAIASIC